MAGGHQDQNAAEDVLLDDVTADEVEVLLYTQQEQVQDVGQQHCVQHRVFNTRTGGGGGKKLSKTQNSSFIAPSSEQ